MTKGTNGDRVPVIAVDGPSGSGKGTLARALAHQLGWHLLDSGALYRIVGAMSVRRGIALDPRDERHLEERRCRKLWRQPHDAALSNRVLRTSGGGLVELWHLDAKASQRFGFC